jgi:hypothetical protein
MPWRAALRRKYPALPSRIAPDPQNFEDSRAHWNKSPPFCRLAVGHKDHAVLPIQVLDTHPEEFSFVPHSCVAHQDDDVPEKFASSWAPAASQSPSDQFPFRFMVKTKVSFMLFHHFNFRRVADHLPLLRFVQHSCRNVRKAQFAFAAEPGNFNCSAQSPVIWLALNIALDVDFSNRQQLGQDFLVFLFESAVVHPVEKAVSKLLENSRFGWK